VTRVYGYATGVFSSRKLERATYDSVAFRFIAANDHPDHDTIATFRRRFLKEIEGLFVQVLALAPAQAGHGGARRTKIHANASRGKIHPNVRAGYCYSVTNGGSCPGPNRGSITRHG
jgi:transposase